MSSDFDVVGKTPDGKRVILSNGMELAGNYKITYDDNGRATISGSGISIWGTSGPDGHFDIKADNSTIDLGGGGDTDVSIFGHNNIIKEINDGNHKGAANEISFKGNQDDFNGGKNTKVIYSGNESKIIAKEITVDDGSHNYLEGHKVIIEGGACNTIKLTGEGSAMAEVKHGEGNEVYDNRLKANEDKIIFGDPANWVISKTGAERNYKNGTNKLEIFIIHDENKKLVPGASSLEQENPPFPGGVYFDPKKGKVNISTENLPD